MNKFSILVLIGLVLVVLLNLNTGCSKDDEPTVTDYIIATDSVLHPDTVSVGTEVYIEFYGKVGDNNCYKYLNPVVDFGDDFIEVTLVGQFTNRTDCSGGAVYISPATIAIDQLTQGAWKIIVVQPEGQAPQESIVYMK